MHCVSLDGCKLPVLVTELEMFSSELQQPD